MQAGAEGHVTPDSWLRAATAGFGVCCCDHLDPFQRSARVTGPVSLSISPTAVQTFANRHETPFNGAAHSALWHPTLPFGPRIDQLEPFHCSVIQAPDSVVLPEAEWEPTATHADLDVHETLLSVSWSSHAVHMQPVHRFGVLCRVQWVPFHRSASVTWPLPPLSYDPTAVHAVVDVHDTALRSALGWDVGWIDQRTPFHRSANISPEPPPSVYDPTAIQAVLDGHDTPLSELDAPRDLAVRSIDHREPFHRSISAA